MHTEIELLHNRGYVSMPGVRTVQGAVDTDGEFSLAVVEAALGGALCCLPGQVLSQLLPQRGSGLVKGCTAQPTQALPSRNSTLVTVTGLSLLESS